MKSILILEYRGESYAANMRAIQHGALSAMVRASKRAAYAKESRPWVATLDSDDRISNFVNPLWQRQRANSTFTRGTELCFVLSGGFRYRVHDPAGRGDGNCIVTEDGEIKWLNDR